MWKARLDLDPGPFQEFITKHEWRSWLCKFRNYSAGSTINGEPTDSLKQVALYHKLDANWLHRLNQAFGDAEQKKFKEITDKILEILEKTFPKSNCQAEFFQIRSTQGRTPHVHYSYKANMSLDCSLESLTPDETKVMITIKSLDKADSRLREKTLEKAATTPITHEVFLHLLLEHETWFNQQSKGGSIKRVGQRVPAKASERPGTSSSRVEIQCFCCS